mgnify:CR=1 FL=1
MSNEIRTDIALQRNADLFAPIGRDPHGGERIVRKSMSNWQHVRHRLVTNKLAMTGLVIIVLIVLMAILAPLLSPHDHFTTDLENTNRPPSLEHWFGTDDLGRDMFVRTWKGAQVSLFVGVAAALIDLLIGVVYGGIMGYYGGKVDEVMNRIAEILYAIPYLLVVIMLLVVMEPSLTTIIVAMSITGWINMAWIVRGQIMQLKTQEYALASRALGAGSMRILSAI